MEVSDGSAASNVDTIPQQQEQAKVVSPVDAVDVATIDKIVDSIVSEATVAEKKNSPTTVVDVAQPADGTAASKGETLPQPSTTEPGVEPKDVASVGQGKVSEKK